MYLLQKIHLNTVLFKEQLTLPKYIMALLVANASLSVLTEFDSPSLPANAANLSINFEFSSEYLLSFIPLLLLQTVIVTDVTIPIFRYS